MKDISKEISIGYREGTYPVPRPAMMMGCLSSGGSFMTEGLIETVTLLPGARAAR